MQGFLRHNPVYWCFVPLTQAQATAQNRSYTLPNCLVLYDSINATSIGSARQWDISGTSLRRADELVRSCMRHVPSPPVGYTFSIRQRVEQFQYFKNRVDVNTKPHPTADIFNIALIAVRK